MKVNRVNVLGVGISALNIDLAVQGIVESVRVHRKGYVCITGVHGVIESQDDPRVRETLNNALYCTPDGMPMVWLGKLAGQKAMTRVYGPDLMLRLCEISAQEGFRHFFYGGSNAVTKELRDRLCARFPGLQVVGIHEPPFRPLNAEEERALTEQVRSCRPDFFWVGLSTPKQEKFMAEYLPKLDTTVMLGVGAAFDFHSGRVRQAPGWMQRNGLEWLFRLCMEPRRRLWKRYLKNNPRFVGLVLMQWLRLRRFDLPDPRP